MKSMKWMLLPLLVLSYGLNAEIFKCEVDGKVTFSSMPCGDDAELVNIKTSSPSEHIDDNKDAIANQCLEEIKKKVDFKDPRSAYVADYKLDWISDDSGARRIMLVKINSKNSYGGYPGSETYLCYLNFNATKVSGIQKYIIK